MKNLLSKTIKVFLLALVFCVTSQAAEPQWWKGNLHMHSLWSDGRIYPEVAVDVYKKMGYNFISLTDHSCISQGERWTDLETKYAKVSTYNVYMERFGADWIETREVDGKKQVRLKPLNEFRHLFEEPGKFMLIQGEEVTEYVHLNAINIVEEIPPKKIKTVKESIDFAVSSVHQQEQKYKQPMLLFLNHPNWRWKIKAEDFIQEPNILFFELYNSLLKDDAGDDMRVSVERMWDIVLTRRLSEFKLPVIYGLGTDDTHYYLDSPDNGKYIPSAGRAWIMVRAKYLTPESIITAMQAGDFYVSNGVLLDDVNFDGKTLNIKIKPAVGVEYITEFLGTFVGYDADNLPVLDANGNEINTTRKYSKDIGRVLKAVDGTQASYCLTGKEIYVRARVRSDRLMKNSDIPDMLEMAWTQPVKGKSTIK
ncbi:MAG: hypothetical protein WC476_12780 [Phycisphaerae bacterium]|jgi:histidinol phosphatase-like PHP family hydrolase